MDSLYAYFLGLLTMLIILIPFWILSNDYSRISDVYLNVFCKQAFTYPL
jgi:hypothetical protein